MFAIVPTGIILQAALFTAITVSSLSYVAATAKTHRYLYWGGPLTAGLTVVCAASFVPLLFPAASLPILGTSYLVCMAGGMVTFGGLVLVDTQRVLMNASNPDAVGDSIALQLDIINIFIRWCEILIQLAAK
jgi:FtsH-binding integral membrane protein